MTFRAAFFRGTPPGLPGLFNRAVRAWERGPHSHMELNFSDGVSASSSFLDGGVRFRYDILLPDEWDFITLPDEWEAPARAWFVAHEGKAYDYWADIRFINGFALESQDKWMCVESCMEALGFEEPWRFGVNTARVALKRFEVKNACCK